MTAVTNREDGLSSEARSLLARRRERALNMLRGKLHHHDAPSIPVARDTRPAPLSGNQRWLWNFHRVKPDTWNHVVQHLVKGPLNVAALEQSLAEIIRRHGSLRTTFPVVGGEPVQLVSPFRASTVPLADLRGETARRRQEEVRRAAAELCEVRFDLADGPLVRSALLRLGEDEHVLLLAVPHIIADGWSVGVCMEEFRALYEAFRDGRPSPLPELPIQFADFASWEQRWLQSEEARAQLDYWKRQLEGTSAPDFCAAVTPTGFKPERTYALATRSLSVGRDLTAKIREMNQRERVTLFMTVMSALMTTLHQLTGQEKLCVSTASANRTHEETKRLIGFFSNVLAIGADFSGDPTWRELQGRVRETILGAYEHQSLPLTALAEAVRPDYDFRSIFPLHRVVCSLDETRSAAAAQAELTGAPSSSGLEWGQPPGGDKAYLSEEGQIDRDLVLQIQEGPEDITLNLLVDRGLFDRAALDAMLPHLLVLLRSMADEPERQLSDFPPIQARP
ncbi:MAG TPA: condensation domain-containing protein [Pyrinomonadaceae bacterium]|jgi:hypothetical protein|nr:condensation domain-containing protein [Pyrinomonadaceae bacterium]